MVEAPADKDQEQDRCSVDLEVLWIWDLLYN